jgi:hypothetical protein
MMHSTNAKSQLEIPYILAVQKCQKYGSDVVNITKNSDFIIFVWPRK